MFPVTEEVVVVEQVLVPGEDVLVEVPVIDDRYDYYVERANIATACVNYALDNWQKIVTGKHS